MGKLIGQIFYIIIYFLPNCSGYTQDLSELTFDFYNPKIKLYVVGENHLENDSDMQLTVIDYLQKHTNIDVFIVEYPVEAGIIFNEYVLYGRMKEDVDKICDLVHKKVSLKTKCLLEYLRKYNCTNPHKIEIRGLDRLNFEPLKRQVNSLSIIFPLLIQIDLPLVNKYINKQKVNNYSKRKSLRLINSLITELEENRDLYYQFLGNRTADYENSLNHLKFFHTGYSWRKSDSIREAFMSVNLNSILDTNKTCVMICGDVHALNKENDTWYYGYPFTSMVAAAKKKYPNQIYSIVTLQYEKKLYRFFPEFNLLSNPLAEYFEDCNKKYEVISGNTLINHPEAKERCDMIIVQNTLWKNLKK